MIHRSTLRNVLTATSLLFLSGAPCYSDYRDFNFRLKCDSINGRAEIIPYVVYNNVIYTKDYKECDFNNGTTIRVKMGLGIPTQWQGQGEPAKWLTIWINKAKVISQMMFECDGRPEGPCDLRVVATKDGVDLFTIKLPYGSSKSVPNPMEEEHVHIPSKKFSKERDKIEFPAENDMVPPSADSFVTIYERQKNICSSFDLMSARKGWEAAIPKDAEVPFNADVLGYRTNIVMPFKLDMNNDGKTDNVIGVFSRTHYRDGDIYFVFGNIDNVANSVASGDTEDIIRRYGETAAWVVPHSWTNDDVDNGEYELKDAGAPWWDKMDRPAFSYRYWHLQPFKYGAVTYFLARSEGYNYHWCVILRPEPDNTVTEMCVFQRVRERY